jgi:hypothetical protein
MDTEQEETTTLADDLEAAWAADETNTQEASDATDTTDTGGASESLQAAGSEDGQAGDTPPGEDAGGQADNRGVQGAEAAPEGAGDVTTDSRAPVSWNATARETWKDIPKGAQDYIAQREREMEVGIKKYAENSNRARAMDQVLQPYGQYFAVNGGAGESIKALLAQGATMQMGTPTQKAQMVANMISQFGVDISTLDNMLVGKPADPSVQQSSEVQQAVQQAIAPFQQYMTGMNQQRQQAEQAHNNQIGNEVETFASDPANEFYKDVSNDMADILDMAANRNLPMTMPEAYERACALNPDIARIKTNRTAAVSAANKRRAGASIHGTPGGAGGLASPGSMRDAIEQAWDNAGQV